MSDIALILKALQFAAERHKTQVRKGRGRTPYINHPIQVACLLADKAGESDPVLLAAAILHDVVEDTVTSVDEQDELKDQISDRFGKHILSLVMEVTDDKTLPKEERKRLQVERASFISVNAKKIKLADKIMNIRDITNDPPVDWSAGQIKFYFSWAEDVVNRLRGVSPVLEQIFDESLRTGRSKYGFEEEE